MISKRRILAATLAATMLVCGIPNVTKAIEYNGATSGNSATSGNNASEGNTSSSGNTASDGNTSSSGNVQEKGKPEITFELDALVIKDEQKGLNYISVDDLDNNPGIKVNVKDDKSNIVQTVIKVNNTEIINITYDEDNQKKSKEYNIKLEKDILKDDKYVINVTSINANNIDSTEEKVIYVESKAPEIINDSIKISGFTEEKDNYIIGNKLNVSFDTDSDNNNNQSSIETVEFYLANTNSTDDIKNKSIILKYNNINNSNTTLVTTLNYEMVEKGYYTGGYLCAYIKDICGKENYVLLSNKKLLLDNDNPTCTISINNNDYSLLDGKKWIKVQDIESYGYNYEISDNGSGIKEYSIKVNGNEVSNKTENIIETTDDGFNKIINGSFELKDYTPIDGKYEIVIEAADNADNKSEESDDSKDIIYVDENAPYIDGKVEFKNITNEDDFYMYGNILFNVKDDELSSEIDKVEIYEYDEFIDTDNRTVEDINDLLNDSNRRGNAEITDGVATYTIIAPNPDRAAYEKYVYAKLYDKVGNYRYVALSDKKLIIEQNAPKISIDKKENSFYSNWFNKNVKYEITITDEESGIDVSDYNNKPEDYKIEVNNKQASLENIEAIKDGNRIIEIKGTYTTDYKIGGVYNYIVSVKARDNAGNDNSNISKEIGIDTKPPYVINDAEKKTTFKDKNDMEISPIGNEMFTNDDVKVNFYVKDEISGVNNVEVYALDSIIDEPKDSEIEQNKINPADVKISDDEVNVTIKRQDTTLSKYIYAKLTDNAGNSDYVLLSENKLVIEKTAPEVKELSPENVSDEYIDMNTKQKWIKGKVTYNYAIKDEISGIASYEIYVKYEDKQEKVTPKQNGNLNFAKGVVNDIDGTFELSPIAAKDGKYTIVIEMSDNAGNHKQETYTVYYDSNTPKATKFTMKSDKYIEGNSLPVTDDKYGYYFKHTTKVTVTLADDGTSSGISKVGYFLCKNGEKVSDAIKNKIIVTPTNNEITIQIPEAFRGQIYVAAVDNVGNGDLTKASSYVKPDAIVIDDNRNDKDIITINRPKTAYKDNSGLDLYNKDIPVVFNIKDVTSGIRSIEWEVTSANGEENNYSGRIDIDNSGKINGDNYNVISTDKNLITAISKAIAVRNNDNRITVNIRVEDRAGNISYATDTFSIDKTAPEISISYDNNIPDATNGKMFKSDRKAIISIKERNFNPKNVVIDIKNTDGIVPIISDWSVANGTGNGDNTTYTASLSYVNDGDYTFAMRYQDNADNIANINFVSGTVEPTEFTIDKTRPALSVQFNNNSAVNGNYYLDQRVATFTIIEHNFDASRFELLINRNNAAVQQNINWINNGDTHTASIALDEEALYSIMANYTDMAGNTIENAYNTAFYIDKKAPEVIISGVDNERAYRDNVVGFNISSADTYFESLSISLDLLNKDGSTTNLISNNEEKANVRIDYQNIENGRRLSVANLESDGIYRLVCKASDKAGRVTENNVLFSINRNGPTYYIDDEETLNIKDKYLINPQDIIFNEINVNELSADTIKITVYRGNTTWDLVEGKDYTIEKVEGIDTWCKYRYIISKDNFEENGIYHVTIASKDSVENDAISEKFSFVIDNEPPVCTIFELKKGNVYVADSKDIRFKVTDNIEAESVIVLLNGKEIMKLEGDDIKKNMSEDGTLKITIPSSNKSQNLIIKCIDKSGNESETEIKGFYITTNLWIRFINNKPLVIGISCAVVAIIVLIILMIIRKSNKNSTKITEKKTEKNK